MTEDDKTTKQPDGKHADERPDDAYTGMPIKEGGGTESESEKYRDHDQ